MIRGIKPRIGYLPIIIVFHLFLLLLFAPSILFAKQYGDYDPKRILTVSDSPSGKKYSIDLQYLDQIIGDLALHAKNYPPQFDTAQDKQRAAKDVKTLSGMLDILVTGANPNKEILLRAGYLNSIGHNLDIPGSAERTASIFHRLLTASPSDPRGNYMYGTFLAGAGKLQEALPYLEKALSLGVKNAAYSIGMAYLSMGNKKKALSYLETYRQNEPDDKDVVKLIDAIRSGELVIKQNPS